MYEEVTESYESVSETNNTDFATAEKVHTADACHHA